MHKITEALEGLIRPLRLGLKACTGPRGLYKGLKGFIEPLKA
jgi:hypothetical protein